MRFSNRLLILFFFVFAMPSGFEALAQTATNAVANSEDEDLRKTVRELALRVSALEEELHRQRVGTTVEPASLKPTALLLPAVDVRSSVESVSSSRVAETAPVASSALGGRTEYLSDRGGLFSGTTQALKEFTGTYEYKFGEGFLTRVEYRRDWSNVPFFLTNKPGVLSPNQPMLTVGMVWSVGGKQGAW